MLDEAIMQINFTGNLERAWKTTMFLDFLDFSQGTVILYIWYLVLSNDTQYLFGTEYHSVKVKLLDSQLDNNKIVIRYGR